MRVMSRSAARDCIDAVRRHEQRDLDNYSEEVPIKSGLKDEWILDVRDRLEVMKKDYPNPAAGGVWRFEAEGAKLLHSLWRISPDAVAEPGFWIYLSVAYFPQLIEWRHGRPGRPAREANYGLENRWDGLLLRMWMRGEIAYDTDSKSYDLAQYGDQDFWRSHILRQNFGSCRTFARAFVSEVYAPIDASRDPLTTPQIRDVAKRLCRLYATTPLEMYNFDASRKLIAAEITRTLAVLP